VFRISFKIYVIALSALLGCESARADEARDALIVQTILKLESFDYEKSSSKVKDSVSRYLQKNVGSEEYYTLVEKFLIEGQLSNLQRLCSQKESNSRAANLLFKIGGKSVIASTLKIVDGGRDNFIKSIGSVNDPEAVSVLQDLLSGDNYKEMRVVIGAMSNSPAGQERLLDLCAAKKIPSQLKQDVSILLSGSVDPVVRSRAAKLIPLPASLGGGSLPPVNELVALRGDSKKGEIVYLRSCFTCHKVGEKGIDFGPALSEIGDKLAREAMYVSIMSPNQAISFGYEGFTVKTKTGNTLIGYVVSDGDNELAMKVPGGAVISTDKSKVESRVPLAVSLMPSGLVSTMTKDELVNLVEYLMTLKKKSK
jgi:putative heme-binding domain-containing protein|tara:strand:- start:1196 stop:2296 length:1101 start_codon:yes stop_codon:yes gene_type:complete